MNANGAGGYRKRVTVGLVLNRAWFARSEYDGTILLVVSPDGIENSYWPIVIVKLIDSIAQHLYYIYILYSPYKSTAVFEFWKM